MALLCLAGGSAGPQAGCGVRRPRAAMEIERKKIVTDIVRGSPSAPPSACPASPSLNPTGIWETEYCGMETRSPIRREEAESPAKWLPQTGPGRANALSSRRISRGGKPRRLAGTFWWSEMDSNQRYLSPYCLARLSQLGPLKACKVRQNRGFLSKGLHYIRRPGAAIWPAAVMRGGGWGGNVRPNGTGPALRCL